MDKDQVTETLANMSVGAATATGFVAWLEKHASLMSLLISALGVTAAIIFYWLNYRLKKREFELKLYRSEHPPG